MEFASGGKIVLCPQINIHTVTQFVVRWKKWHSAVLCLFVVIFSNLTFIAAQPKVVGFPTKYKSQYYLRVEKLIFNGDSVKTWKSTDTNVATVNKGIVYPKKFGSTFIIAKGAQTNYTDTCLISITAWFSSVSKLDLTPYLDGYRLMRIWRDTLYMQGAEGHSWGSIYTFTAGMAAPKIVKTFPGDPTIAFDEENMLGTPFGNFVLAKRELSANPRKIYKVNSQFTSTSVVNSAFPPGPSPSPLSQFLLQGWTYDSSGNIYAGQYLQSDTTHPNYQVMLFKATNQGQDWQVAYKFPPRNLTGVTGGIRHVHSLQIDPYTGDIWVGTGDGNNQSRIYRNTNKLTPDTSGQAPLKLVGYGTEEFRAVSFAFSPNYIYWFMDAQIYPQKIFRIPRMVDYPLMIGSNAATLYYRQTVGTFRDKPFWNNFTFSQNGNTFAIVEAAYEDAKQASPTFRELDTLVRLYTLKENNLGEAQVQEVFSYPAQKRYAHFYPIGKTSDGYCYFASQNTGNRTVFRGKLTWIDVDSVMLNASGALTRPFAKYPITLKMNATKPGSVNIYQGDAPMIKDVPNEISTITKHFWNTFSTGAEFNNLKISIPLTALAQSIKISDKSTLARLVWLMRDQPGGTWKNYGGSIEGANFVSLAPLSQLNDFGVALTKLPVSLTPETVLIPFPPPTNPYAVQFSTIATFQTNVLIDSAGFSGKKMSIVDGTSFPVVVGAGEPKSLELHVQVPATFTEADTLFLYSAGNIVGEVPFVLDPRSAVNPDAIEKNFTLYQNYPNPFNGSTVIEYNLPETSSVKLQIFSMLGERVADFDGDLVAGRQKYNWSPGQLSSGIYFCTITAKSFSGQHQWKSAVKLIYMK